MTADTGKTKLDPARKRWLRTDNVEFVQYAVPDGEREHGEGAIEGWGITHILSTFVKRGKNTQVHVDLSEMTVEEIDLVRDFMNKLLEDAREVCELRDRLAEEAFRNGEDAHYRLYRRVPQLIERKGPEGKLDPGKAG